MTEPLVDAPSPFATSHEGVRNLAIELASKSGNWDPETCAKVLECLRDAADTIELHEMLVQSKDEQIARQVEVLEAVGYPVLQIAPGILCLPVIGPLDLGRIHRLMDIALAATVEKAAREVILDLTGAMVSDVSVAETLAAVARALSLLGARVSLSGIRADIARMLAEQNETLGGLETFSTLEVALASIGRASGRHSGKAAFIRTLGRGR